MSYFLRELIPRDSTSISSIPSPSQQISEQYARLIKNYYPVQSNGSVLRMPLSKDIEESQREVGQSPQLSSELCTAIHVVGPPSSFATVAIAKCLLAKYGDLLEKKDATEDVNEFNHTDNSRDKMEQCNNTKGDQLVHVGMSCVFNILRQLSRRDPELCVQAIDSLTILLQSLPVDSLRNEPRSSIESMIEVLRCLREEGSPSVCSRASSCLAALAVCSGLPDHLMTAVEALICTQRNEPQSFNSSYDDLQVPENLLRLNNKIQQRAYKGTEAGNTSWFERPLDEHKVLCSFDLPTLPVNSLSETPDDDLRLQSSIACDGAYVYVLNYVGFYKMGSGLQETVLGKLYASNTSIKATRNCLLTFCNGSLYLRRGQSSCISVIDIDSLRDIGEVVLPTECVQSALFSDGFSFYHASVTSQSTLHLIPLNDLFVPVTEPKSRQSVRLTDISFCCMGDKKSMSHQLPMTIPKYLHNQAADLHIGKEIAFLQSRSGKIYYAGDGIKYGLQETGTTWMELVLPESIVEMSVGAEYVLFRSGSGHAWIAGGDDGRRAGKLRRLSTVNRRKIQSVSSAAGTYGYVTDNGRVFVGGRHGMSVYSETGQILGLDGLHMSSLALGKTHAVAISKQGYVYTWGLNNMNQCGRVEQAPITSSVSPRRRCSVIVCEPSEHLFVKDLPSYCTQCGLCSARGAACPLPAVTKKTGTCSCGPGETACLRCGICRTCGESAQQRPAGDTPTRTHLAPARLNIVKAQQNVKVSSVSCGNFHTLLLAADGTVFSFGSNCHGQLGTGDVSSKSEPQIVLLPPDVQVAQVAAGANHSVLRTTLGAVYTFGAHKMGQLIRTSNEDYYWHATPQRVPGFGPGCESFATWIGAVGDVTLVHSHTVLIRHEDVVSAQLVANKHNLFIFPRQVGKEYVAISRKYSNFAHHRLGPNGLYTSWCLESQYDILWSYNAAEIRVQAHSVYLATPKEMHPDRLDSLAFLFSPEWALPLESPVNCSSIQLGIMLLSCTYAATTIIKGKLWNEKDLVGSTEHEKSPISGRSVVCRFESTGGGWGYSAHSIEAIQVKANKEVRLLGIGLYGGRGEYIAKIKLFRLPSDVSDEQCAELLSETDETLYDCGQRETAALMLAQPVIMKANHWHVFSAKISGPSSDCGATGRRVVECNDDVIFTFRNSAISNNGTDVNVGQIPELYYQVVSSGEVHSNDDEKLSHNTSLRIFSSSSIDTVSPCAFFALLHVFDWSLARVFEFPNKGDEQLWNIERAAAIGLITMRILSRYVLLIYRTTEDSDEPSFAFADAIVLLHSTLLSMFDRAYNYILEENFALPTVLSEAVSFFVNISSCLMPSFHLFLCHLALAISSPTGHPLVAAVIGSVSKKDKLIDVFLHRVDFVKFPHLSKKLAEQNYFTMSRSQIETLTALPNILRFLYEKSFSESNDSWNISVVAQDIVVKLSKELAIPDVHKVLATTIVQSSMRFRRRSAVCAWDMSEGATDAICIRVDGGRIALRGVGVYLHAEQIKKTWHCEIYMLRDSDQFSLLTKTSCELNNGGAADTGIILLPDSLSLTTGVTYAVKVWTSENGRTYCGEGGVNYIRLSNGARLTFSSCPLSENGTSLQRGQIPYFLYSVVEVEKTDLSTAENEIHKSFVVLLRLLSNKIGACLVNGEIPSCARSLVSRISGHVMVFMELFPHKAMEVTCVLEQLVPMVSSVNGTMKTSNIGGSLDQNYEVCEAKTMQVTLESPHPYKADNVHSLLVAFDDSVHFLCLQFSPSCETAQADDQLRVYMGLNRECYVPVGRYFGSKDWPSSSLLLPGNSLWFVLETTVEVEGATAEQMYGFHCTVTGYPAARKDSNLRLEQELTWLSANACRIMVQLSHDSSASSHLSPSEDDTRSLLEKHGSLLKKGLSLTHTPTLNELIQKGMPQPAQSADLIFLREFLSACTTSTAGFLARWLPSGPVVDPSCCQLSIVQTDMVVGKPVKIRLTTKDQFDREVTCPMMCVEVFMTAGDASIYASARFASAGLPSLDVIKKNPFQPVLLNRCRYMSISAMPAFLNYSYEEIRLGFTNATAVRESTNLKHKNNCTFEGEWTPTVAGSYRITCRVDGCELTHNYLIEVSEKEENLKRREHRAAQLSRATKAVIPASLPFQAIRMRLGPSLTAQCVGTIPRGGTISYIEEFENEDGKWLRLTDETAVLYGCSNVSGQVWCLAYHQHLRRELIPIACDNVDRTPVRRQEDPPTRQTSSTHQSVIINANETYVLNASQRIQLYSRPSPDAPVMGAFLEGRSELEGNGWVSNQYGVWVRVADTNQFILAENSDGSNSVLSQSLLNGNEEEERSAMAQKRSSAMSSALRPSVIECCRAVFAAFLWHEHLVKDAMAAAAYLRYHQHLHNLWSHSDAREAAAPAALQPIVRLWIEVCTTVKLCVDQHLIVPPSGGNAFGCIIRRRERSTGGCELCDCSFKVPVTVHMRANHPGCGQDAQGYGYNSFGKFTSGWSGNCGSGGRAASTWYLLCPSCRAEYLRKTPAGHRQERTRRWREFRLSTNAFDLRPEIIMRQNAMFLLDLNSSLDNDSKASSTATSGWTINLFPTQTPSPSVMGRSGPIGKKIVDSAFFARSSFLSQSLSRTGHASDPGPKVLPASPGIHKQSFIVDGTRSDEGDTREVLQSPSAALRTLISHHTPTTSEMLKRPVLSFIVEHHDLKRLRASCEQSIFKAVGFSHAFRAWNWLLRLVSSETSVSDIILQYLTALSSYNSLSDVVSTKMVRVLPHPWRLCFLAGPLAAKMVQHFHAFLYTIAVILQSSGVDARLRSLCFKAWTIQLTAHEQELLILTCNILGTVGGVLSEPSLSENWITDSVDRSHIVPQSKDSVDVKELKDVTCHCRIEASSRQAMVVCLTDGSPDTFWESGEEDKNRSRTLNVTFDGCSPVLLCVFIDNSRDDISRTSQITFRAVTSDGSRCDLMSKNLDQNFSGWVKCCVANVTHVNISLKGPYNASRVRQLQLLGFLPEGNSDVIHPSASHQLLFNNTQHDAFALFQAISAQAFSGDSCEQQDVLRERVVDLLFSRVTLQPLQNYVCTQVEAALEREVERLCSQGKRNYSYAVGLLTMANRMCESRSIGNGDCDVAVRHKVLHAASRLLVFAPETVQTQCLSSLYGLLPLTHASAVDVSRLLKHLLIPVAKALVLQVRDKVAHSVTTATMNSCLTNAPLSWRTDRSVSPEIGKMTAQFISDVCSGAFNEEWSICMRRELATSLLGVIQLTASLSKSASRESMYKDAAPSILNSKRFWLSVAALALIRDRSWLTLSEKWNDLQSPEPGNITWCENHDDGTTAAQVFCSDCECALCRDCFSVMHLHKRNRSHRVTSLGPPPARLEEIDIHQGCARMKVANLLILFHGESLNGLVELPSDPFATLTKVAGIVTGRSIQSACRFCGNVLDAHNQLIGICSHPDCVRYSATACHRTLPCGHLCGGIAGEKQCLPCLTCGGKGTAQDGNDVCVICFTDRLCAAPCIRLGCSHLLHYHCVRAVLEKRWAGPRIQFRFMNCPLCNVQMSHPGIKDLLEPLMALKADVMSKANMRLKFDGLLECMALMDPQSEFFGRPEEYAMDRYMYVLCNVCQKAYFGGENRCQLALQSFQYNAEELVCGGCSAPAGTEVCGRHGAEYLEYKCRYCCSLAVYFCFGTTHFCAACHDDFQRLVSLPLNQFPPCPTGPRATPAEGPCPLRRPHPPAGEEFALGCGICRNISTF